MADKEYKFVEHQKPYRYQADDGLTVTRGSAWSGPGCHLGCGVLLYTDKAGKLVRIEGDPENPFNKGRLCVRCLDAMEAVYNKDRLTTPLKRDPKDRGKDKWEPISWEEAYDTIETKFKAFREEYGPESVAMFQGTGRDIAPWITHFAWSFGTPNNVFGMSGNSCYGPRVAGATAVTGSFWVGDYSQQFLDRYDNPQWKVPDLIVVWGNNPLKSNSDGLYGHWVVDCMKRGSKIITVDPRRTWLANKAEVHLPIRPGTDAALGLGILHVLIDEDLYDHDFVEEWCYGFDELCEAVKEWTPEKTAQVTWIPAEKIVKAARIIGNSGSMINQWGVAVDMQKNAIAAGHAIIDIQALTGNMDNPGGMICPDYILMYYNGWGGELLDPEKRKKRIGDSKYPMIAQSYSKASADEVYHTMKTGLDENGEPHVIKGAWIQTTNFLVNTAPDPDYLTEAFHNMEFVAAIDMFMTPTIMELADVVLPAASFPERQGIRIGDGVQRAETINRAVDRSSEGIDVRSDMQVNMELGKRFNADAYPWDNVEDMFSNIFSETGMDFYEVRDKAPVYLPFEYYKYKSGKLRKDGKPGFNTPTGKVELWSNMYSYFDLDPVPTFHEPTHSPYSTPDEYKEFPVVLTTGSRNWSMFHSEHRQIPRMRALHPDPTVLVNTKMAEQFAIKDGDWVWLRNQFGKCKRKVVIDDTMREGVASTDHGWWFPEDRGGEAEGLFGAFDYNVNRLFQLDPGPSGFGCDYKNMLCTIEKVEE
jgi:anaerobic selenocysteine-containing dehydrogenase